MKIFVLVLTFLMYGLLIVFSNKKSWIALATSVVFLVFGAIGFEKAVTELVHWNILMIYIGSLVIADLFLYSRVPGWLSEKVVEKSPTLGIAIAGILVIAVSSLTCLCGDCFAIAAVLAFIP